MSTTYSAIARAAKETAVASAAWCVGDAPMLVISAPSPRNRTASRANRPPKPPKQQAQQQQQQQQQHASDGARGGGSGTREVAPGSVASEFTTPRPAAAAVRNADAAHRLPLINTIPFAFDSRSSSPAHRFSTPLHARAAGGHPPAAHQLVGDGEVGSTARVRSKSPDESRWWRHEPPLLVSSLRVGQKTPSLAVTLSSKKESALAGAPCCEPPFSPAGSRGSSPAHHSRSPARERDIRSPRGQSTVMAPTATSPCPPLTDRPSHSSGGTLFEARRQAAMSAAASGALSARAPRSAFRRQQWEQHEGVRATTPNPAGMYTSLSRRGLLAMRRRDALSGLGRGGQAPPRAQTVPSGM